MAFRYLVEYNTYSRVIEIDTKSDAAIETDAKDVYADIIPATSRLRIQQHSDEFNAYVDVTNCAALPDKGRLQIFVTGRREDSNRPQDANASIASTENLSTNSEGDRTAASNSQPSTADSSTAGGCVPFPMVYRLPSFPMRIQAVLSTDPGKVLSTEGDSYRRSIIQALYDQCERYENNGVSLLFSPFSSKPAVSTHALVTSRSLQVTSHSEPRTLWETNNIFYSGWLAHRTEHDVPCAYLHGHQYDTVCRRLITDYPGLADQILPGASCSRSNYETWKSRLICKFKTERQKCFSLPEVREMQAKYGVHTKGNKRTARSDSQSGQDYSAAPSPSSCERKKLRPEVSLPVTDARETPETIQSHVEALKAEIRRQEPRAEMIKDRMTRTAEHRLELYKGSVAAILEEFPVLQQYDQLLQDFERFFKLNQTQKRAKWFNTTRVEHLLKLSLRKLPNGVDSIANMQSERGQKHIAVLANIIHIFREKGPWIQLGQVPPKDKCIIVAQTPGEAVTSVSQASLFTIYLDGECICNNAPTLPLAVDTYMAVLYLFNVSYNSGMVNSCRFLSSVVYGLPCDRKITGPVQRVINSIPLTRCACGEQEENCECSSSGDDLIADSQVAANAPIP